MLYGMNSQRGVSYDPSFASKSRTEEMLRAARAEERREHARYLDQVEHAYRERRRSRRRQPR